MKRYIFVLLCIFCVVCVCGCDGAGGDGPEGADGASLSFRVDWVDKPATPAAGPASGVATGADADTSAGDAAGQEADPGTGPDPDVSVSLGEDAERVMAAEADHGLDPLTLAAAVKLSDDCSGRGVVNVRVSVRDSSGTILKSATFACSARQGTLTGVTPGSSRTIRVSGLNSSGTETWRGEKTGVTLAAGDNNIGVIQVEALGGDPPSGDYTNSLGMTFVKINPGTFWMGSPTDESGRYDDEIRHQVTLTKGYYLQTTEVTQGQWIAVMGSNPSYFSSCGANCPVEGVSWDDIQDFITALNALEGITKYRLPTEAEWEYAARAGSTTAFANGPITETGCAHDPNLDAMGWYCGNAASGTTHPVAQKQANVWGLYDMHGNVWEWCADWYDSYPSSAVTDPAGPSSGTAQVLRGGSWFNSAGGCRSASRYLINPDYGFWGNNGFRLVLLPGH